MKFPLLQEGVLHENTTPARGDITIMISEKHSELTDMRVARDASGIMPFNVTSALI